MNISILRLGHRIARDKRMTTHVALTARAFGSECMFYTGMRDKSIESSIDQVNREWGGNFKIQHLEKYRHFIKNWKNEGKITVHLTMFGIELEQSIKQIQTNIGKSKQLLIILGGAKVPIEIYHLADYNIAIGNQPHSEIAALAVFLDNITGRKTRTMTFPDAKVRIIPQEKGKKTIEINGSDKK